MSSDLSFAGSTEHDLNVSKVWLCQKLPRKHFKHVYVLGSWYGNMGLIMRFIGIDFDCITNVETNPRYCRDTVTIYRLAKFDRKSKIINKDCNLIDYADADLVINTSTNDIRNHDWFANIPPGCTVAVQCRNNQPAVADMDKPATFREFKSMFEMHRTVFSGKITLSNSDETYDRYMLIGIK